MSRHTIVVLDGYTLNPGDLSWDALQLLGNTVIYDRTPAAKTVGRCQDAEIVLTNKTVLDNKILSQLKNCKYIGVMATGYNVVDTSFAEEQGILVTHVPAYGSDSVAQMVFAHILHCTQSVALHNTSVQDGEWSNAQDWCYWHKPLIELCRMNIGIIGFGKIGRQVAQIAAAFGMKILVNTPQTIPEETMHKQVDLKELFRDSDFITLHCPLTSETHHMINENALRLMKSSAYLINTSRGDLIDEYALSKALDKGWIKGAGLDVLSNEPPKSHHILLNKTGVVITPHIAWATKAARQRLLDTVIVNVKSYLNGSVINIVNR